MWWNVSKTREYLSVITNVRMGSHKLLDVQFRVTFHIYNW